MGIEISLAEKELEKLRLICNTLNVILAVRMPMWMSRTNKQSHALDT